MITAALIGNPNVGKTSLFNILTGSNQYVGNWAGVTVDKTVGFLNESVQIVDLPGIYAMDTYSNEEKVAKNFLLNEKVDVIINIVDASNLDRNLYLTTQLKQFNKPIILVLNMIDVVEKKGITIDYDKLSKMLGVQVIPIIAAKNKNIDKVKETLIEEKFLEYFNTNHHHRHQHHHRNHSERVVYRYIGIVLRHCLSTPHNKVKSTTEKIDKIFLNKFLAYPLFALIILIIFECTFSWVGGPLQNLADGFVNNSLIPYLHSLLSFTSSWFSSLLIDGIVGGVGSIVVFLPIILTLFFCISILEDSGYMARAAFLMDIVMRKMGLSGKAFIPLIIGFGCSVPAIMSSRTLESEKDRKLAALLVPFMSCNAKLPIYALLTAALFPKNQGLVIGSLYLFGIIVAFIMGKVFRNSIFKKDEEPLVIELPEYKVPTLKNLLMHTWDKGKDFLKKAGTIIFSISVIIWFLSHFGFSGMVGIKESFLAAIGQILTPLFKPLGFGTWQNSVSIISGLAAKEVIVSTMSVLYGASISTIVPTIFTPLTAYAFLVFVLLYPPCISALATIKKEYGTKMMISMMAYQIGIAWVAAFAVYRIGSIL